MLPPGGYKCEHLGEGRGFFVQVLVCQLNVTIYYCDIFAVLFFFSTICNFHLKLPITFKVKTKETLYFVPQKYINFTTKACQLFNPIRWKESTIRNHAK